MNGCPINKLNYYRHPFKNNFISMINMQSITAAILISTCCLVSCQNSSQGNSYDEQTAQDSTVSEDSLLNKIQQQTFQYFWDGAEPTSGLARERIHLDGEYPENDQNVITIGGSGFGIMGIIVAMERGYITKEQGLKRLE